MNQPNAEVTKPIFSKLMERLKLEKRDPESIAERQKQRKIFGAIVRKEVTDYLTSWRIIILLAIIVLTCIGSLYTSITTITETANSTEEAANFTTSSYLFLRILTLSDGTLPPFTKFVSFFSPLLAI